ncbi:MAG: BTAD domain-containing putative transcriptional regulator [Chloroflexota bacterium]|nr:BTAD domain-containing putative transcriptional regulator [Chloroflexota bacterium]
MMKLNDTVERSYQHFQEVAQRANVILLHPAGRFRSPLVACLIESGDYEVLYYALGPDDISVESIIAGMTHDLANQRPLFGRHLNMLSAEEQADPERLVTAVARELAEIQGKPPLLVLDEYDRSDIADDVQIFVEKLASHLPANCRVVINSRSMPRLPWVSMIAKKHALMINDERVIDRDFYGTSTHTEYDLEVYGLGPGFVIVNGTLVEDWEGHLPRLLFFFALDKPVVTRSEICRSFWPELDIEQAVNVFHVTKRRLHKALGVDFDVLLHEDGYYRLNPALNVDYDVMSFVSALMDARTATGDEAYDKWQRAVEFYRGPFMQGHDDAWLVERREDFRAGFVEALSAMADIRMAADRKEHALSLLLRAVGEAVYREDVHQRIMRLYMSLGRRSEGAAHYVNLEKAFRKASKALSDETVAVYNEMMA